MFENKRLETTRVHFLHFVTFRQEYTRLENKTPEFALVYKWKREIRYV